MAYTEVWDETKPAGTRDANLGDDDIREFKRALRERFAGGGMNFPSTDDADAGLYNWINFIEQSGNPTSAANRAFLFTKDSGAITELYWMDSAGTVVQLTVAGKILLTTLGGWAARGDMIRGGATGWEKHALGASGKFWKSDGTDAGWGDAGFQTAATEAEMEAASSDTVPVTPAKTQHHPGVAKFWVLFQTNGTILGSHNVTGVVKNATGIWTITIATDFANVNWAPAVTAYRSGGSVSGKMYAAPAAGSLQVSAQDSGGSEVDADLVSVIGFGIQ